MHGKRCTCNSNNFNFKCTCNYFCYCSYKSFSQLHADSCKDCLCLIKIFDALTGNSCPMASEDNVTPLTNTVTAADPSSLHVLDGVMLLDVQCS